MDIKTKEMYSEIYSILGLMEEKYVEKIPENLYNLIKDNRIESYNPVYNPSESLINQNIKKETATMLVLLKLNYWCDSEEEKNEIRELLKKNSREQERIMRAKYSSENMFKHLKKDDENTQKIPKIENVIETEKSGFIKNISKKIAKILNKKDE